MSIITYNAYAVKIATYKLQIRQKLVLIYFFGISYFKCSNYLAGGGGGS